MDQFSQCVICGLDQGRDTLDHDDKILLDDGHLVAASAVTR